MAWPEGTSIWRSADCWGRRPLSAASIARLKASWQSEYDLWKTRELADLEPVYLWVDGIHVKAGLEKDKAAMLVVLAALRDGRKVIVAVESGHGPMRPSSCRRSRRVSRSSMVCASRTPTWPRPRRGPLREPPMRWSGRAT